VLINDARVPVLMDGGLPTVISRASHLTTAGVCGPCRWMAPEVLDPPEDLDDHAFGTVFTMASDVYSLGMTILEVFTREVPFSHRRYDTVVVLDVIRGLQPQRPQSSIIPDQIWSLIESCWKFRPENRPSAVLVETWLNVMAHIQADRESHSIATIYL
jgi:serine/threonine protein kinase